MVFNKSSVDRGLGRTFFYRIYEAEAKQYPGGMKDNFELPQADANIRGYRGEKAYRLLEQDPDFRLRQAELEQRVNERLMAGAAGLRGSVTTIPAVVHVVYRTSDEKVAAAQVKSQLAALNKDYRATNPDRSSVPPVWLGLVTDARVQFALATRDPTGKKTAGIV